MNVTCHPSAEQWGEGKALIQQATKRLEDILGPSAAAATAAWERTANASDRLVYRLTLKDFTGSVTTDFGPAELQNPAHLHVRLYRLWGDLLQIRNNVVHGQAVLMSGQIMDALKKE